MTNFQRLATVRTRFLNWLQDADQRSEELDTDGSSILRESMLIRDEFFCGRKFHAQHFTAVWFIEEDVLKIHRADGTLELVLRGAEIDVCEQDASDVEAQNAAVLQLNQQPARDDASPEDVSSTAEPEPRILKLMPPQKHAVESAEPQTPGSGEDQLPEERKADVMDSTDQGIRKAA